jgi:hypothetical protein
MSADIVNLKRVRKAKARAAHDREAEANRRLHGMSKAERERIAEERRRLGTHLEGHRREGEDEA